MSDFDKELDAALSGDEPVSDKDVFRNPLECSCGNSHFDAATIGLAMCQNCYLCVCKNCVVWGPPTGPRQTTGGKFADSNTYCSTLCKELYEKFRPGT